MPNGTVWTNHCFSQIQRFEQKIRQELFEEARRPVDSITPEQLEKLYAAMEQAKRFSSHPSANWEGVRHWTQ
jgi:hypothetical protein